MGFKSRRGGGDHPTSVANIADALRSYALAMPGAQEEFPWGERVVKVRGKVFVFLGRDPGTDSGGFAVKLPISGEGVRSLPFTEPTGYGLGRAGWISVTYTPREPIELLESWIEESYRAIAPKKLVAELDARLTRTDR